jgi:osmotically inducible lipoprotein OsmB
MKAVLALLICILMLAGCENLSPTQNRLLGGTAAGATGGAIIGAMAGNAGLGTLIGAGVGLAGGAIYNHVKNSEDQSYQEGYAAGRQGAPPSQ